jgi:hypothetical protein
MLSSDAARFERARGPLEELFGPVELESPVHPFEVTTYYAASMGPGLQRKFLAFERLADAGALAEWKLACNALEQRLRKELLAAGATGLPERPINIDPGYISASKLVLASTKDFAHRVYLREGIFAEITLAFRGEAWVSHQFTFPDFKSGMYDAFLRQVRERHMRKMKSRG